MKQVWILRATGATVQIDGRGDILCKYVFTSREAADAHMPSFKVRCTTPDEDFDMQVLRDDGLLHVVTYPLEVLE